VNPRYQKYRLNQLQLSKIILLFYIARDRTMRTLAFLGAAALTSAARVQSTEFT
jgi:hypothetical protein